MCVCVCVRMRVCMCVRLWVSLCVCDDVDGCSELSILLYEYLMCIGGAAGTSRR